MANHLFTQAPGAGSDTGHMAREADKPIRASRPGEPDFGIPGASARREFEARQANRERRVRDKHRYTAGLRLAIGDAPTHETNWSAGASGEVRVAAALAAKCNDDVTLLHDRKVPGSRMNIDHLAVAPSGVWVIDAKRYKGTAEVQKSLFGEAKLKIDGRDKTKLIVGLGQQVELIRSFVETIESEVEVHGALCFVETALPHFGTLRLHGFPLIRPKALARMLNAKGNLVPEQRKFLTREIALHFPPA